MNRLTNCAPKSKDGINRLRRFFLKLNLASPAIAGHRACHIFRKLSLVAPISSPAIYRSHYV